MKEKMMEVNMKPRIFVSSTFYDLKYIRDDLSTFIKAHGFESIMFEDGDVCYTPGKPLDLSCYETLGTADMVVLIIGGNYGSAASGETKDGFDEYISVTRKEFDTARSRFIPIYIFIEEGVFAEYGVYEENFKQIEDKNNVKFKVVKDINVFRFIKNIKEFSSVPIISFKKSSEIKEFLDKQWSDMFKKYLDSLKEEKANENTNVELQVLSASIDQVKVLIDGLSKKLIVNEDVNYKELLKNNNDIKLRSMARSISSIIKVTYDPSSIKNKKVLIKNFVDAFKEFISVIQEFTINEKITDKETRDNINSFLLIRIQKIFYRRKFKCQSIYLHNILNNIDRYSEFFSDENMCFQLEKELAFSMYFNRIFFVSDFNEEGTENEEPLN